MHGNQSVRFSDLFADTVNTHGLYWACCYYLKRGMAAWEVEFWAGVWARGV